MREALEGLGKRSGKRRPELDGPEPPRPLVYLLDWFADLNMDRQSTGFGPASITSGMILDWARGKGYRLRPSEFDTLRALNRVWMKAWAERNPPPESESK